MKNSRKGANLNNSKISAEKQNTDRQSSRKRDRDERNKYKNGKRSSKTRYNSYKRQNSSKEFEYKQQKERGTSAYTRPHSAKDPNIGSGNRNAPISAFSAHCDYKDPDEFHKLRYSIANNGGAKTKRPSSAKRKNENLLKNSNEYKNSFLDMVAKSEANNDAKLNQYEVKKSKNYERKRQNQDSRKRSSSKDRANESPKSKYSRNSQYKSLHKSRSRKENSSRSSIKTQANESNRHISKTKSSADLESHDKQAHYNSTSLKFNSILKDMGVHSNTMSSPHLFKYTDKALGKEITYKDSKRPTEYTHSKHKFSSTLEARKQDPAEYKLSYKSSNVGSSSGGYLHSKMNDQQQNDIYMMNTNMNHHHHHFIYNNNTNANPHSRDHK